MGGLLMEQETNAFEALCEVAENQPRVAWCWSLHCQTCGHALFRDAFLRLIAGYHPRSAGWRSTRIDRLPPSMATGLRRWPWNDQFALSQVLGAASVRRIYEVCQRRSYPSSDWLGYLGLGLCYTQDVERQYRRLTQAWLPELLALLPKEAESRPYFEAILQDPTQYLRWQDLERFERDWLKASRSVTGSASAGAS